jgi:hypothetical protein
LHILIIPICEQGSRPSGVRAVPCNACGVVLNLLQKSGRSVGNCSPRGDQIVLCSEISESTKEAEEAEEAEEEEIHLSFEMRFLMELRILSSSYSSAPNTCIDHHAI